MVVKYILENELPIIINDEEINVFNDFYMEDKIKFIFFLENLPDIMFEQNGLTDWIREYGKIRYGFYEDCINKTYELPVIFHNYNNSSEFYDPDDPYVLIIDYLNYYDFKLNQQYNSFILDNSNMRHNSLAGLLEYILEIKIILDNNSKNYNTRYKEEGRYIHKKMIFNNGKIETEDIEFFMTLNDRGVYIHDANAFRMIYYKESDLLWSINYRYIRDMSNLLRIIDYNFEY
jgi:hypothetical protein